MVHMVKFNDNWKIYFQHEKELLSRALSDQKTSKIEHIGATSVVLCDTSGTIDLLLSIRTKVDFYTFKNVLIRRGYQYIPNMSNEDMFFFIRRGKSGKILATVRLVEFASDTYNKLKLFRFYLKEKDAHVFKYNEFRHVLATKFKDNNQEYEKAKISYIESILETHCDVK